MCDLDEEVGMLFLEEKPITKQDLKAAIRRQTMPTGLSPSPAVPPSRTGRAIFARRHYRLSAQSGGHSAGKGTEPRYRRADAGSSG